MLQINANNGRRGYDGVFREWREIEVMFKECFGQNIIDELSKLLSDENKKSRPDSRKINLLKWCIENTAHWLVATPEELEKVTKTVDKTFMEVLEENRFEFRNKIRGAYGYEHDKLIELSNWLHVKTCPYCNMQYTLFIKGHTKVSKMAKFQFDHFYPQSKYPMLSMSLYNLIPSCASCNQGKSSKKNLDLIFHPYHAAIKDAFKFIITNPLPLLKGQVEDVEKIEMQSLVGEENKDTFESVFHIEALYQNHRDIAKEVFLKSYMSPYYRYKKNLRFLKDAKLLKRLQMGFYIDEEDIELRPLSKLQQDLWKQAKGVKIK